jgi:hypothetical protein
MGTYAGVGSGRGSHSHDTEEGDGPAAVADVAAYQDAWST